MSRKLVYLPVPDYDAEIRPSGDVAVYDPDYGHVAVGSLLPHLVLYGGLPVMLPNENFRKYFPEWYRNEASSDFFRLSLRDPNDDHHDFDILDSGDDVRIGLYAAVLGISTQLGLYPLLVESFGAYSANVIMDLVICCMIEELLQAEKGYSMTIEDMESQLLRTMRDHMGFSIRLHDADWYASFLAGQCREGSVPEAGIRHFLKAWPELAAKAHLDIPDQKPQVDAFTEQNILACIRVSNEDLLVALRRDGPLRGLPLSYHTCPGTQHDDAFWEKELADFRAQGIPISSVMADRPFYTPEFLNLCQRLHLEFLVRLPPETDAFQSVIAGHQNEIAALAKRLKMSEESCIRALPIYSCSKVFPFSEKDTLWSLYVALCRSLIHLEQVLDVESNPELLKGNGLQTMGFCMFITSAVWSVLEAMKPSDVVQNGFLIDLSSIAFADVAYQRVLVGEPNISMEMVLEPLGITRETLEQLEPMAAVRDKLLTMEYMRTLPRSIGEKPVPVRHGKPKKQPG